MIRVSPEEVLAAKLVPIKTVVSPTVPLDKQGFGLCPFHDENSPSFHIHVKRNRWKCFGCGMGGDTISFVRAMRRLDFASAVKELVGVVGDSALRPRGTTAPGAGRLNGAGSPSSVSPASPPPSVRELWAGAKADRLAELYLYSRGIKLRPKPLPDAIRGHERCWCSETRQHRPAVLAALSAPDGSLTALQRIWVDRVLLIDAGVSPAKGTRATDLEAGKKTLGPMGAGAVRLAEPGQVLGIAEGVETALSAAQLFRCPVWAALGAHRLGSIFLPSSVKKVVIFGDLGPAGEKAAAAAVIAYRRRGYTAESVFPDLYADFNEMLMAR